MGFHQPRLNMIKVNRNYNFGLIKIKLLRNLIDDKMSSTFEARVRRACDGVGSAFVSGIRNLFD